MSMSRADVRRQRLPLCHLPRRCRVTHLGVWLKASLKYFGKASVTALVVLVCSVLGA